MRLPVLGIGVLIVAIGGIVLRGQTGAIHASEVIGDWSPLAIIWAAATQLWTITVFGGVEITVPRDWKVEPRVSPVFGRVGDETLFAIPDEERTNAGR